MQDNGKWGQPNYFVDGRSVADVHIRYEHLAQDFQALCDRIGAVMPELPFTKNEHRGKKVDYRAYFDAPTQAHVADLRAQEIDYFGWTFDG
ncbi:hypothetical protein [Pseudooctadecabacter jejudonensis]|nr:hypothetical protein [Pseudooctadecabacter jejudonensis]